MVDCMKGVDQTKKNIFLQMGGPSQEVISIGKLLGRQGKSFRTLDLGSGAGRNSIFLATLGSKVCAVDCSDEHLLALCEFGEENGLEIETSLSRVEEFVLRGKYDLTLCHGILHFLPTNVATELITNLKNHTPPGGVHIVTISYFQSNSDVSLPLRNQGHRNSIDTHQLLSNYQDWRTVAAEKYVKRDHHPGQGYDTHPIQKFVFQRPGFPKTPLLEGIPHKLEPIESSQKIRDFFVNNDLRTSSEFEVIRHLGSPDYSFRFEASGSQLSFRGVTQKGHLLKLIFWGRSAGYFENNILVGYSEYETNSFYTYRLTD
jgi:SAM-dependent methyltransferase